MDAPIARIAFMGRALREVVARAAAGLAIIAAMLLLLMAQLLVIAFGRADRRLQIARGMSRALNGATDGDGDVTFSAQSAWNEARGKRFGRIRRALVDALPGNGAGHCADAMAWHLRHDLFKNDAGG